MSKEMVKVNFILPDGTQKTVESEEGISILDVAQSSGVPILGLCEGSLACSTCHVIIEEEWFSKLSSASADEEDMLDMAVGLKPTSRLSCQLKTSKNLDGIVVKLPPSRK